MESIKPWEENIKLFFSHLGKIAPQVLSGTLTALQIILALLVIMFIAIVIARFTRRPRGTAIFAFDIMVSNSNKEQTISYDGKSIADSLRAEIARVAQIHVRHKPFVKPNLIDVEDSNRVRAGTYNDRRPSSAQPGLSQYHHMDHTSQTSSSANLIDAVTIKLSENTISIGRLILACKQLSMEYDPVIVISGSLQRFGKKMILIARVEHRDKGKQDIVCKVIREVTKEDSDDQIADLCEELAFQICQETSRQWDAASITNAKTWEGFKHLTEAIDTYDKYLLTGQEEHLNVTHNACLQAHQAEQAHPGFFLLHYNLANEYYYSKNYCLAKTHFEAALAIYARVIDQVRRQSIPTTQLFKVFFKNPKTGVQKDREFLSNNQTLCSNAVKYLDKILCDPEEYNHDKAIVCFEHLIRLYPENPNNYNELGLIYNKLFLIDLQRGYTNHEANHRALNLFTKAIQCDPHFADAYNNRGLIYERLNKTNQALTQYKKALRYDPTFAMAHCNIALIRVGRGQINRAIKQFEKAATHIPNDAFTYDWLGYLYTKQGQLYKALGALALAVKFDPNDRRKRAALAATYRKLKRNDDYGRERDYCQHMKKQDSEDKYIQACVEALCSNTDKALHLLEKALNEGLRPPEYAQGDSDFDFIRDDSRFKKLVGEQVSEASPVRYNAA